MAAFTDQQLVVGCRKDRQGPAKVDIIDRQDGKLVKTVVDTGALPELFCPYHIILAANGELFVSSFANHCVYKMNLSTGTIVQSLTHAKLQFPQQLTMDPSGTIYVCSTYGHCILAVGKKGDWCRLLDCETYSNKGFDKPYSLCLVEGGIVVGWNKPFHPFDSILITYSLQGKEVISN